jgi:DNA-directed RNA polymerase specialized sigma24 family protein
MPLPSHPVLPAKPLAPSRWSAQALVAPTAKSLVHTHASRVYNLVRRLLGHEGDTEGVVLDVLVQAAREEHLAEQLLPTRLLRATLDAVQAARQDGPDSPPPERWPVRRPGGAPTAPNGAPAEQTMEELIAALHPALRDPFVLADVEGLPIEEVADLLNLGPALAQQRLHRARLLLGEALLFPPERRQGHRLSPQPARSCRALPEQGGPLTATLLDLAASGASLLLQGTLSAGQTVNLCLGRKGLEPLEVPARVVYSSPGSEGGTRLGAWFLTPLSEADIRAVLL